MVRAEGRGAMPSGCRVGIAQCALGVIGQNHSASSGQQRLGLHQQVGRTDTREAVLEIQSDQLLAAILIMAIFCSLCVLTTLAIEINID